MSDLPSTEPPTVVARALRASLDHLEHRDRMNAVIHLGDVRWSPLTDLVREGVESYRVGGERVSGWWLYRCPCGTEEHTNVPPWSPTGGICPKGCEAPMIAYRPWGSPDVAEETPQNRAEASGGRVAARGLAERMLQLVDEVGEQGPLGWTDLRVAAFRGLAVALAEMIVRGEV